MMLKVAMYEIYDKVVFYCNLYYNYMMEVLETKE